MNLAPYRNRVRQILAQRGKSADPQPPQPFSFDWLTKHFGHYQSRPSSQMHRDFVAELGTLHTKRKQWKAREAPRGNAKSTYVSKAYPLWAALEGVEPFILLLSDTADQAEAFLADIKSEIEANDAIAESYPHAAGVGPIWQSKRIRLRNGVQIAAYGAGGRVRGRGNRAERPSLVIVDDANEKADAFSSTMRRRKWDWFTRDVMSVGNTNTNFFVVGTPIHREAISHRLRNTAGWDYRGYRAIQQWPDRMDLWLEWERVLTNLGDPDRANHAEAFYAANQADMDAGAVLLWPEWESLYDLMRLRAAIGPSAFDSEKQDKPGTDGATEWPSEYFDGIWFDKWPDGLLAMVLALDPSKGANEGSDYQAHALVGVDRGGTIYAEVWNNREDIKLMATRTLNLAREFKPSEVVVEENGTMGALLPEYERQMADRSQLVPLMMLHNIGNKEVRIRGITGYLARSQLRIRNTQGGREFVSQGQDFPSGEFDDSLDAVSIALRRLEQLLT